MTLLRLTGQGLYCEAGGFHVDPWGAVDRAVVTHAHGDHVAWGCGHYLTSAEGAGVLRARLTDDAPIQAAPYGRAFDLNGVRVSLHPAGHILGSAQVRLEHRGEVWVVSGDYKTDPDPTCTPYEPVRCHTFVTESTFGLPIYRWPPQAEVLHDVNRWWRSNQEAGRTTPALRLRPGQGAAPPGRPRPRHRADSHARGGGADDGARIARAASRCRRRPTPPPWSAPTAAARSSSPRPRRTAPPGSVASASMRPASPRAGCWCGGRGAGARSTGGSRSPITSTGPA